MALPACRTFLLGLLLAALLPLPVAGQEDDERPGALRGSSYSSSYSSSESWSSGSDGKMHSQVRAVREKTVGDGKSSHSMRAALACADGRCREATVQGPGSIERAAADGSQSAGNLAQRPADGERPRSIFGRPFGGFNFGGMPGFGQGALRPHFVLGGMRMPAVFGGTEEDEEDGDKEEPTLAEDDDRDESDFGFGGDGEFKRMKDFVRGMDGRMAKGEAKSSSFSKSYSYSSVNGKEQKEQTITRCKNGECTTVKSSNMPTDSDKKAQEIDRPSQAESQQILLSTGAEEKHLGRGGSRRSFEA